jgi:hypothetical protein
MNPFLFWFLAGVLREMSYCIALYPVLWFKKLFLGGFDKNNFFSEKKIQTILI